MSHIPFFVLSLCFILVHSENVHRKFCRDVDTSMCSVHSVTVDPCINAPRFCRMKRRINHIVTVDFTPRFSADFLNLAVHGDNDNDDNFDDVFMETQNGCKYATCPMNDGEEQSMSVKFNINANFQSSKFPIRMKLWNPENENQACCFTFRASYVN
uniref:Niemann Pick type C n=1 Tax=Histia rhodope TaxID=1453155 RepID=A0A6M3YCF9_9NEOP|nr:Niemann Pick type C [Histia rhodope]